MSAEEVLRDKKIKRKRFRATNPPLRASRSQTETGRSAGSWGLTWLETRQVTEMGSEIDNDSDGQVDHEEFVSFVFHQEEPRPKTDPPAALIGLFSEYLELQEERMDMRARAGYSAAHDAQYGGYESPRSGDAEVRPRRDRG